MKILGYEISFTKPQTNKKSQDVLGPVTDGRGGWFNVFSWGVREGFTGAWQHDVVMSHVDITRYPALFSCVTLISSDVAKMGACYKTLSPQDIWEESESKTIEPVLKNPNGFQTWQLFIECWLLSKLLRGNAYILKVRDRRTIVTDLFVLDPSRVTPVVSDDGQVFYRLAADNLSGLEESVTVPASEIIHDRWNCMFHPLIGISPIYAAASATAQGMSIQHNSTWFFKNKSQPGGFLTAPGAISNETATRLKDDWAANYSGENAGKIAVAGDGLKYESMTVDAVDAQLIEQLKWTGEVICSVFHVPPYKVGVATALQNTNIEALNTEYYSQCLQKHIEGIEFALHDGLDLDDDEMIQLDIDKLLRMDTLTLVQSLREAVQGGIMAPNEARKRLNLKPVKGGESPYLQQQNYSLDALAKRDAQPDPFAGAKPSPAPPAEEPGATEPPAADQTGKAIEEFRKGLAA